MNGYTKLRLSLPCPENRLKRTVITPPNRMLGIPLGQCIKALQQCVRPTMSQDARMKEALLLDEVHRQLGGSPEPYVGPVTVNIRYAPRNKRVPDLFAYCKQLMDVLEKAGVYENDQQACMATVERLDPAPPGWLEIEIVPLG